MRASGFTPDARKYKLLIERSGMINIAVVEDTREHAEKLNEFIMRYAKEQQQEFFVEFFENGMDFVSDYGHKTDIVFMDIEMPHMNGMDCALRLRKIDENVPIIFVTSTVQYAVRGYEVDALGYMVKPVSYFPFKILMDKVIAKLKLSAGHEFCIQSRDFTKRIFTRDLFYVEITDHYLIYHTKMGEYRVIGKMKEVEEQLSNFNFFRCSNSHLVNLLYVEEILDDKAVVGGEKIFISRRRKKEFLIALNQFLQKGGH